MAANYAYDEINLEKEYKLKFFFDSVKIEKNIGNGMNWVMNNTKGLNTSPDLYLEKYN